MPFADYDDFDDCVAQNQDKDDPEAYCGKIKADTEMATVTRINREVGTRTFRVADFEAAKARHPSARRPRTFRAPRS